MDSLACNYNPEVNLADGSCTYPELGYDCEGNITAQIGDVMECGIVFYLDETGKHGLVAAMEDLVIYEWGCYGTNILGADGQAIGTGYQNTLDIVAGCSGTNMAAFNALSSTIEGYTDWYLPSLEELQEMYNTIGNGGPEGSIDDFENHWYWSSSEDDYNRAWVVSFSDGGSYSSNKSTADRVRVIRAF